MSPKDFEKASLIIGCSVIAFWVVAIACLLINGEIGLFIVAGIWTFTAVLVVGLNALIIHDDRGR